MTFPSREDTSLAAWAHAYAAHGWPVFPLRARDKRPITTNGFHDASTHRSQVARWWDTSPTANIGVATGIAFDVLDIDGWEALDNLDRLIGNRYRHNGPVSTTGKGWHVFFAPTGQSNGTNLGHEKSKIDFRGRGGYIVAPPSLHPLGHRYRWSDRGPELHPPEAPEWLGKLVERELPKPARPVVLKADPTQKHVQYMDLLEKGLIPDNQVPRDLRQRAERPPILEVCEDIGLPVRRSGMNWQLLCIFHAESTPSLVIYPHDNTFHCFGCGAHGDSFDLLNDPPTHI